MADKSNTLITFVIISPSPTEIFFTGISSGLRIAPWRFSAGADSLFGDLGKKQLDTFKKINNFGEV
jgi:hypothetical protein